MADDRTMQKGTERLWLTLDDIEKGIVFCLFHVANPVSIETLVSLSGASISKVLNFMEKLKSRNLVSEKRTPGKGVYFLDHIDGLLRLTEQSLSDEGAREATKRIIGYYAASPEESEERTLILAKLYLGIKDSLDGVNHLWKAAEILYRSGEKEKAIRYFDHLISLLAKNHESPNNAAIFLDSVLHRLLIQAHETPTGEKLSLLAKAERVAKKARMWGHLAQIRLAIARDLQIGDQHEKASRYVDGFWRLARRIQDPGMLKAASLSTSFLLFSSGDFAEAVRVYEDMIGNLEEFGDDEATLNAGLWVAYSFVICGRVSRGMGMIDAIRTKAASLGIESTTLLADFMAAHAMLEVRNIGEAESYVDRILDSTERAAGPFILWGSYACKAFVLCAKGEYAKSFECHCRAWGYARPMGWVRHVGPWTFEYLKTLEANGFKDELMTCDSEIKKYVKSGSTYMKGVAFRHRALEGRENRQSNDHVLSDLKNSEKLLKTTGAEIELARTMVALGSYYAQKGDLRSAQPYARRAFSLFSEVDKDLVPRELLELMPQEQRIEVMIGKMTTLNKSLGKLGDVPYFLGQAVDIAMRFAAAKQGAFFVIEPGGEVAEVVCRNLGLSGPNSGELSSVKEIIRQTVDKGSEVISLKPGQTSIVSQDTLVRAGIDSFLCMPAGLDDHIYGYLYLGNRLGRVVLSESLLPFLRLLCSQLAVILSNIRAYQEMKELKDRFETEATFYKQELGAGTPIEMIVGQSNGIERVVSQIRQVAPTDSTVLVLGETGVGKELVAKAIHNLSERRSSPFIPVNLSALPHDLVASELFGHEKGAFTGANERHTGRFELANGGTIFLDEIGDLPLAVQVKLLRILQEGTFERLGGTRQIQSDFRVIAATNKDLHGEVEKGTFRRDLYYRLNVFPIVVPPLRERKEDIPLLVHHFIDVFGTKLRKKIGRIPSAELRKLIDYPWPGNVRELQHLVERSVILANGNGISFPIDSLSPSSPDRGEAPSGLRPLEDVEREHIQKVLNETFWRIKGPNGAAAILKLQPSTLHSRMKKLGIRKPLSSSRCDN